MHSTAVASKCAELMTRRRLILNEVERTSLVRSVRKYHWSARAQSPFANATATDPKPFLTVDAQQHLVVRSHAFPRQQVAQAAIAEPATFRRLLAQPFPQCPVIRPRRLVTDHRAAHANQTARPTLA